MVSGGGRPIDSRKAWVLRELRRIEILALVDRGKISPSEVARRLRWRLNVTSYHVKVLCDHLFVELAELVPARSSVKHMYRSTGGRWIEEIDWGRIPKARRPRIARAVLEAFSDRLARTIRSRAFEFDDDTRLAWVPVTLDEASKAKLVEVVDWALGEIRELEAETAERQGKAGEGDRTSVTVAVAAFSDGRPLK